MIEVQYHSLDRYHTKSFSDFLGNTRQDISCIPFDLTDPEIALPNIPGMPSWPHWRRYQEDKHHSSRIPDSKFDRQDTLDSRMERNTSQLDRYRIGLSIDSRPIRVGISNRTQRRKLRWCPVHMEYRSLHPFGRKIQLNMVHTVIYLNLGRIRPGKSSRN